MGVWPPGAGLQGQASNHLMLLRLRDVVVSDEEKASMKVSGVFREDERKRTTDEASKWVWSEGVALSSLTCGVNQHDWEEHRSVGQIVADHKVDGLAGVSKS